MKKLFGAVLWSVAVIGLPIAARADENWPQFRGPGGQGHSDSKGLPIAWSETKNVKWKTPMHGRAWSSPVVWGKQVWVSTATRDGRELFAVCVDRDSGAIVHNLRLFDVEKPQFAHDFNTYASPTPVIEEGRIYVTFGSPGTACLDTRTGQVLWERRDLECNHYRGAGSSPILFENLLIMNFDGSDFQYVIALDKRSGRTVWKSDRSVDFQDLDADGQPQAEGDFRKAFSTPHVALFENTPVLISLGAKAHYAYDPRTGKELWRTEERKCHSASSRPVVGTDRIIFPTGFSRGELWAVRPGGSGNVTETHVLWKVKRSVANKPSVLLIGDLVFMIDDGGVASCIDARTGAEVWQERVKGNYSASPVYADGRIYFFSEEGKSTVIAPAPRFEVLAQNQLDDGFMASPAIAGGAFFLRTKSALYRIEEQR